MSLKLALRWELHRMVARGPHVQMLGILRHPAALPLCVAAWSSLRGLMDGVGRDADPTGALSSLSRVAVQLGCALLGAFELRDIPSLEEVREFTVSEQSRDDARRAFGRKLGQLVEPVACAIAQRDAQQCWTGWCC